MKLGLLILLSCLIQVAQAIPEKNFSPVWHHSVEPYFLKGSQRTFVNKQGLKLNFHAFTHSSHKKTMVILPGRIEPAYKYAEIIFDLRNEGFNIYILDHQGQGASDRLLKDSQKGHVKFFSDYVTDFKDFMDEVVVPESQNHVRILFSHSMGGAIAALYLAENSGIFSKAVFSAPMMEVNTKPYSEVIARILAGTLTGIGFGSKYAPDRGPYKASADVFSKSEMTQCEVRFDINKEIFVTKPELVTFGPTSRWVSQSLKATKKIDHIAGKIKIPLLMLQAGKDLIVKLPRQDSFCSQAMNCRKVHYKDSYHEILQESDEIRNPAMEEIKTFINNY